MASIGAAIIFYAVLVNRLLRLVQPIREKCAVSGEALLLSGKLPKEAAAQLRSMLDNAYNEWIPWIAIVAWLVILLRTPFRRPLSDPANAIKDDEIRKVFVSIRALLIICSIVVSPIAMFIFVIELMITIVLVALVAPTWGVIERAFRNTLILVEKFGSPLSR
jgi:hypothetical protein